MKNVMIIGALNGAARELYNLLAPLCRPQLCPDSLPVIQDMLYAVEPELVVAALTEHEDSAADIFYLLDSASCRPRVIALGSAEVQLLLVRERYLPGKRFIFLQRPVTPEEVAACVRDSLEEAPGSGRKRILVVDDDPGMVRTISRMLSGQWDVSGVTSASRAVLAISRARPDLILLDYDMPRINGKVALELLRSEKATEDIPVVFLTGVSDPASVEEVLALRPQGYLLKPPSEEKLKEKLRSILG